MVSMALLGIVTPTIAGDWVRYSRRLTGESEKARAEAIAALRSLPNLASEIEGELGGERKYLALDVIAALSMDSLLPALFSASMHDENGAVYLTINALLNSKNEDLISDRYVLGMTTEERKTITAPAQVVILDTLGRVGRRLPRGVVAELLRSRSYSVRLAALYYVRAVLLRVGDAVYLPLVEQALGSRPFQLRLRAISIIAELSPNLLQLALPFLKRCERDPNAVVKKKCDEVRGAGR